MAARLAHLSGLLLLSASSNAQAHVSEQGLVMLLPTDVYIAVGTGVIVLSALALALLPTSQRPRATTPNPNALPWDDTQRIHAIFSIAVLAVLAVLLLAGFAGSRDPLTNPLPLVVWTVWWIGLVTLHGVFGNLWRTLNPWSGLLFFIGSRPASTPRQHRLLDRLGHWPGCLGLLAFSAFVLADPAPDDPARLAIVVGVVWLIGLIGATWLGERTWFTRIDALSMLMLRFAALAPWKRADSGRWQFRLPGAPLLERLPAARSNAVFCILLLGIGSYDGLNETFWWLGHIGVNPLEYPGRTALIGQTITGLLITNLVLIALFVAVVAIGVRIASKKETVTVGEAFDRLAPTLIPIAFGYHVAHYFTSFLVNGQYALVAASDPLGSGRDWLRLGDHFVSTGFFNTPASVRTIWLVQAGAVTLGHVLSLLLAHRVAESLFSSRRQVVLSQLPVVAFMCAYTGFGLWLLAAPKGA